MIIEQIIRDRVLEECEASYSSRKNEMDLIIQVNILYILSNKSIAFNFYLLNDILK